MAERGDDKKMKRKTIVGLIAIVMIVSAATFSGCIEDGTFEPTPSPTPVVSPSVVPTATPAPTVTPTATPTQQKGITV